MELKKIVPSVAEIHGASPLAASVLVQQVLGKGALDRSAGDVTVIIKGTFREGGPESAGLVMATSPVSALPYYYGVAGSTLVHGPSVFKIAQGLGRASEWKWNNRALASLLALGHTIGADTLHSDIRRIPAATLVMHSAGQTIEKSYTVAAEEREFLLAEVLEDQDALLRQYLEQAGSRPAIALTAGLDSRLLVAAALHYGIKPVTLTFGPSDSTDVRLAGVISRDFFLEHQSVVLTAAEQLHPSVLGDLATTAGGTVRVDHLAHAAFLRKVGLEQFSSFTSSLNADCVRSQYADDSLGGMYRRFRGSRHMLGQVIAKNLAEVPGSLVERLKTGWEELLVAVAEGDRSEPLGGLARYHLEEKARHEYGALLGLYSSKGKVWSPFTDLRYAQLVRRLPVRMKKGFLFHRLAIQYFFPGLVDYPVNGEETLLRDYRGKVGVMGPEAVRGGVDVMGDPLLRELVMDSRGLEDWCTKAERERMLAGRSMNGVGMLLSVVAARW